MSSHETFRRVPDARTEISTRSYSCEAESSLGSPLLFPLWTIHSSFPTVLCFIGKQVSHRYKNGHPRVFPKYYPTTVSISLRLWTCHQQPSDGFEVTSNTSAQMTGVNSGGTYPCNNLIVSPVFCLQALLVCAIQ